MPEMARDGHQMKGKKMNMKAMKANWKTTGWGLAVIITALATAASALLDNDPETVVNTEATLAIETKKAPPCSESFYSYCF